MENRPAAEVGDDKYAIPFAGISIALMNILHKVFILEMLIVFLVIFRFRESVT